MSSSCLLGTRSGEGFIKMWLELDCQQQEDMPAGQKVMAASESVEVVKRPGRALNVVQVGTVGELMSWEAVGEEPEEGLVQTWDDQRQEFLHAVHTPHWGSPELPKTMRWEVTKSFLVPSKMEASSCNWPGEEVAAEILPRLSDCLDSGENREASQETWSESITSAEAHRQRFRMFCYQEAEGPQEVCNQLHELCCQWLKPESCTKEQMLEQLILEQFLAILPQEMQSWVREHYPETCGHAVALAEDFLIKYQEAKGWKQQVLETSTDAAVSLSRADQFSLEPHREVKQESGQNTCLLGGDGLVNEYGVERVDELEVTLMEPDAPEGLEESQTENWRAALTAGWCVDLPEITVPQPERQRNRHTALRKRFAMERHPRIHIGPKPHKCADCGQRFTRKANLIRHQQVHTGQRPHLCADCGRSFARRENMVRHLKIHSAGKGWMIRNKKLLEETEACEEKYLDGEKIEERSQMEIWRDKSIASQDSNHFEIAASQMLHQQATSSVSGEIFTRRSAFNEHQREHHKGEKQYKCADCGESISEMMDCRRHETTQVRKKAYKCNKCEKKRNLIPGFNSHKRSYTGEKPHRCSDCDQSFSCRSHLLRHQRVHSGEKPYTCSVCGKSFRQITHLMKHERMHRGPK